MRVVIAPDSFGETLTARRAAAAIGAGWAAAAPSDSLDLAPLSDGGPGFLDALVDEAGRLVSLTVADPLGRPTRAAVLVQDGTAYVESAQACGLHLLAAAERDPELTSTHGVGQLLAAALDTGAPRIVVGLGGSGTNDGGRGALAALPDPDRLRAVDLVAATDVDSPLLGLSGASVVFGPQKGADRAAVLRLDAKLAAYADSLGALDTAALPGAGAAGGLGFALLLHGARRVSGVQLVLDALRLAERVAGSDLVITGEGSYDEQSLRGKAPSGVAALAAESAVPCVLLAGQVRIGRRLAAAHGMAETHALTDVGTLAEALAEPYRQLSTLAGRVARQWSPG